MATGRVPTTANSPLTAKGDLFTYSTTQARLAVGNNGDTLLADSSATTGLRWTATPSASNPLVNAAFDIWQRGTSIAGTSAVLYTADRWSTNASSSFTVSRQTTGDSTNLPNIQYCARFARNSGQTTTTAHSFIQSMESANSIPYAGKTVTMSFYARKGANFSMASDNLIVYLIGGTGTDQNYQTSYTGATFPINNQTATLTTTWQRFSFTGNVGSTVTELTAYFQYQGVGTAGAADYFEITGVQIDVGSVALPFRRSGNTLQGELAACKYYFRRYGGNALFESFAIGQAYASGSVLVVIPFETGMRATPVGAYAAASNFRVLTSTYSGVTPTSIATNTASKMSVSLLVTGASSLTAGNASGFEANNTLNATLDFSAEL